MTPFRPGAAPLVAVLETPTVERATTRRSPMALPTPVGFLLQEKGARTVETRP